MKEDEYGAIYQPSSGYIFVYANRHIGRSEPIFKDDFDKIETSKHNNDDIPLFIICGKCREFMDFVAGPKRILDGMWRCPVCGVGVRERTAYTQLERENRAFERDFLDDDYDSLY